MAEGAIPVQGGAGAPSVALPAEAAGLFEVGDDTLGGAVRDVTDRGDVAKAQVRGARDDQQDAGVIGCDASTHSGAVPHLRAGARRPCGRRCGWRPTRAQ